MIDDNYDDPTPPRATPHLIYTNPNYIPQILPKHPLPPFIMGGTINLLVGSHQSGKTTMLGRLIRDWMSGTVLGQPVPEGAIAGHGILTCSQSWQQIQEHSRAFRDLPQPLHHYSLVDDAAFDLKDFRTKIARVELFEKCLNKMLLPRGSLLWVDPLTLFLGSNLLDFDSCAVACLEIRKILAARNLTMIATAGTAKPKFDVDQTTVRLLDRIYGTVSQLSFVNTCFYLATPDELQRAGIFTLQIYPQHAGMLSLDFVREPHGTFEIAPPDAEYLPILELLPLEGYASLSDLRDALVPKWMSKSTLYRSLKRLIADGRVAKVGYGKYCKVAIPIH